MAVTDDPRASVGAKDIPGDSAAGSNIRYDEDFGHLEGEVNKMDTGGPLAVEWKNVVRQGCELLENRSKDLLIAAYVTYGLYRTEGYTGLALGLTITREMADTHWDGLFPPKRRERARVGSVEWIAERLGPLIEQDEPKPADYPAVREAFEALNALDALLSEKLENEQASLGDLIRPLRNHMQVVDRAEKEAAEKAEKEKAAAEQAAAGPAADGPAAADGEPAPTAAPAPASTAPPPARAPAPAAAPTVDVGNIDKAARDMQRALRDLAIALRHANLADPRAYTALRTATWLNIKRAPPAEGGKTMLPEPPADQIAALDNMLKNNDYRPLIDRVETMISDMPFFLSGHRYTAMALAGLGGEHQSAQTAVAQALAGFLRVFPAVQDLSYQTGAPFVDEQSRVWIQETVLAGGGGGGGDGSDSPWTAALGEARKLGMGGKVKEGAEMFRDGRRAAGGGRARCLWDLAQARFCLETGVIAAALPLSEAIDSEIERLHLEEWEPDIARDAAEILLRSYQHKQAASLRTEDERRQRVSAAQARLCRLDVATAISLMKV